MSDVVHTGSRMQTYNTRAHIQLHHPRISIWIYILSLFLSFFLSRLLTFLSHSPCVGLLIFSIFYNLICFLASIVLLFCFRSSCVGVCMHMYVCMRGRVCMHMYVCAYLSLCLSLLFSPSLCKFVFLYIIYLLQLHCFVKPVLLLVLKWLEWWNIAEIF